MLEELEMADKTDKLPGELSRGMKQKLAIACGLLHSPEVIFFDEPLTGLDPIGIRRMKDSILKRGRAGAEHEPLVLQGGQAGPRHVLVVERHHVAARGEAAQIIQRPVIAQLHAGPDPGGAVAGGISQHAEADAEFGGGGAGHPGQLAGAAHAHGGDSGLRRLPRERPSRKRLARGRLSRRWRCRAVTELFTHGP